MCRNVFSISLFDYSAWCFIYHCSLVNVFIASIKLSSCTIYVTCCVVCVRISHYALLSHLQKLELLCDEVHTAFSGRSLCTINNCPLLCTALLKAACCLPEHEDIPISSLPSQQPSFLSPSSGGGPSNLISSPRSNGSSVRTHSRKSSSGGGGGGGVDRVDGVGCAREMFGRSKPIPIQQRHSRTVKQDRESLPSQGFFPNNTCGVGSSSYVSPAHFPQSWSIIGSNGRDGIMSGGSRRQTPRSYKSWVILSEPSESELESGYEADVERGSHTVEVAESCGEMEDGELREGELLRSLTSYLVPTEVRQRVWAMQPIWNCIDLLQKSVSEGLSPQG